MRFVLGVLGAVLLMLPRTSAAQSPYPDPLPRIFVDVNLLGTANGLAGSREFESLFLRFGEVGTFRATYPKPSDANRFPLVVGGGLMLTRSFGVGVSYGRTASEDVVALAATIPHPTFFNALASANGVTDALKRTEAATNIFIALTPVRNGRTEWRLFGGPSFFSYKAAMVRNVVYTQAFNPLTPQNSITVTGFETTDVKASRIGFHAGSDFTYFLTGMLGISGGVRFSVATVALGEEPLSKLSQDIRVGSTIVFVGVRFRLNARRSSDK